LDSRSKRRYNHNRVYEPTRGVDVGEIWDRFWNVITWVKATFPKKRDLMKNVDWGPLYDDHHCRSDLDPDLLKTEVDGLQGEN